MLAGTMFATPAKGVRLGCSSGWVATAAAGRRAAAYTVGGIVSAVTGPQPQRPGLDPVDLIVVNHLASVAGGRKEKGHIC